MLENFLNRYVLWQHTAKPEPHPKHMFRGVFKILQLFICLKDSHIILETMFFKFCVGFFIGC